jgi:hypothetical protein
MSIRVVLMMLLGWPAMLAVALLLVAASITVGILGAGVDRLACLWPDRVPGGVTC